MPTDIYTLGIQVDSRDVRKADTDLDGLAKASGRAESEVRQFSGAVGLMNTNLARSSVGTVNLTKSSNRLAKSFRLQKGALQQASFQLQDFFVQVGSGQSALVAFSQQGSQLAGLLGPGGAVIGAVIAVSAAIGGPLIAALKGAEEESDGLKNNFDDLADRFREISVTQLRALITETQNQIDALREAGAVTDDAVTDADRLNAAFGALTPSFVEQNEGWKGITDAIVTGQSARVSAGEQLNQLESDLEGYNEQLRILLGLQSQEAESEREFILPDPAEARKRRESLQGELDALWQYESDQRQANIGQYQVLLERQAEARRLATEKEIAEEQAKTTRLASIYQEYTDARLKSEQEAANERLRIEKATEQNRLQISQSFNSLFRDVMESTNKQVFEAGKIGAASKAAVDAIGAINATLAQGGALAAPAALAIGAAAFANVTRIMSTKFGQTGGGSANIPPPPQQQTTNNTTTQNVQNTFNITGGDGQSIVRQIQEAFDSGQIAISNGSVVSV